MLEVFRNSAKGTVGKVIVGLIVITFVLFGADSIMTIVGNTSPASVNGEDISETEFLRLMNTRQQELTNQFGAETAAQLANSPYLREEIINSLVNQRIQSQLTRELELEVSEEQVLKSFADIDAFLIDGEFDQNRYLNVLASNGFNHNNFVASQKAQEALTQMQLGLVNSAFDITKSVNRYAALNVQQREIQYREFNADDFEDQVVLTDDELNSYYLENESSFMSDEQVKVDYVYVSLSDVADQIIITDAEIETAYNSYLAEVSNNESRVIAHILFASGDDTEADAINVMDRLASGESFEDLAAELSEDPGSAEFGGSLGELIPDVYEPDFYAAAKALINEGEVSAPVQTEYGHHLIKLESLSTAQADSIEDKRSDLESTILDRKARDEMLLVESQLSDEAFSTDFIADIASSFQVEVQSSDWLSRSGNEGVFDNRAVVQASFSSQVIDDGLISDVVRLASGDLIAVQKTDYQPEDVKPFDEVKGQVVSTLTSTKAQNLMTLAIENVVNQQSTSEGIWSEAVVINRNDQDLPSSVVLKAFEVAPPESGSIAVILSDAGDVAYAVAVVSVSDGDVTENVQLNAEAFAQQLAGGSQYQVMFNQVRNEADIKVRQ